MVGPEPWEGQGAGRGFQPELLSRFRPDSIEVVSKTGQAILSEAMTLPEGDRLALASELLASIDGPPDADWEQAWLQELDRRVKAAEERNAPSADWAEVRTRILSRLAAR